MFRGDRTSARRQRSGRGVNVCSARKLWSSAAVGLAVFAWAGSATTRASERTATLEAIHQLENPRNLARPGPHGELGAYQFRLETWIMHTATPFARALDRPTSDSVAVMHYEWLKRGLERAGLRASPYNIALAWNSGLTSVLRGRAPRAAHVYATRAANLAAALARLPQIAAAP